MKLICLAVAALCSAATFAAADVDGAIKRGVDYLIGCQQADGHWSDGEMPALTALPMWAICESHLATPTGAVERAAKFVCASQRDDGGFYNSRPGRGGGGLGTYNTAVCLSALFIANAAPREVLLKARTYLASSQLTGDDTMAGGFGYDKVSRRRHADLSNTSYALDAMARTAALEEMRPAGEAHADLDWAKAISFVENLQKKQGDEKGGAAYDSHTPHAGTSTNRAGRVALRAYGSMSYAAVLSLCSARLDKSDARVRDALAWCERNWTVDENPGSGTQGLYYYYDILARALAASGTDTIGTKPPVDWRDQLAAKLVSLQSPDGSWRNDNNRFWEGDRVLCTSFALIALELCRK